MPNTISLILEVDDSGLVKVQNFEKKTVDANKNIGDASKKMGDSGSGGFLALRMAAEKTAESLGVPFRAANKMGDAVSDLAKKHLPQWGMALGAAGVAVGAVTLLTSYFIEKKEAETKAREENIQKIQGELTEMEQLKLKTVEMIAAQKTVSDGKKAELALNLPKQIEMQTEKVVALGHSYEDLARRAKKYDNAFSMSEGQARYIKEVTEARDAANVSLNNEAAALGRLLALKNAEAGKGRASVVEESSPFWRQDMQREAAGISDMQTAYLRARDARISYDQSRLEQAQTTGASMAEINKLELQLFDDTTSKAILSEKQRDTAEAQYDARKIQRATLTAKQTKQINQMELANTAIIFGGIAQTMDQAYALSHNKMKSFFYISRGAAAAESNFQYTLAAAKAAGQLGIFGIPMEAYYTAMSYIAPAMIMAQSFMGSSGGGGGGSVPTGTYDTNSVTGNATDSATKMQPQQPVNVTNIHVMGDVLDMDQFARKLLPGLKKAAADGV